MNENAYERKLQRLFHSIDLIETTSLFLDQPPILSHITGLKQIDSIWVSP